MTLMLIEHQSLLLKLRLGLCVFAVCVLTACVSTGDVSKPKTQSEVKKSRAERALVHTRLARGYMRQKQYSTAKVELDRALQIDPSHSDTNYVMALLMNQLEQLDEAERYYTRAVRNDPENSAAAHDFGVFLCQRGKQRKAVEYFEIAVSNPLFKNAELSYMRAGECLSKVDNQQAESYLKKAITINPRLGPALYNLAVVKFEQGAYFSARAYIERHFAITNPQPASLLLAYQIESNLNAKDVAERYKKRLLKEFPSSDEAASLRLGREI